MNKKNLKNNAVDMTQGSPLGHILKFMLPLLVGNLFQQFYNMVDSIVVGKFVGKDALAAVGSCASTNFLLFTLSSGLGTGIGILVAQYFGAKNYSMVRRTIASSYYVLISVSLAVSAVGIVISPLILRLLDTPEPIFADTLMYMRVTCSGIVAIAMYNGIAAILRALGDSKTPLYFLIIASVINVVLDLVFVIRFELGVFGVGLATVIAQSASALLCLLYSLWKIPYFRRKSSDGGPSWSIIKDTFRIGLPLALQGALIAVSCMVLQGVVNGFGENVMAAFTITCRIESLVQQPYNSLGAAVTTFAGQNAGARKIDRIQKGFRQATVMVLIFSLCLIPLFYIFGEPIVGFFIDDPTVISIGAKALRITSLFYFSLGMIYVPRSLLNGCGDAAFAMINGFSEVACRVVFSRLLLLIPALGAWIVWIVTALTWAMTSLVCLVRYWRGSWKERIMLW